MKGKDNVTLQFLILCFFMIMKMKMKIIIIIIIIITTNRLVSNYWPFILFYFSFLMSQTAENVTLQFFLYIFLSFPTTK